MGRENVKKTRQNLLLFGGGGGNLNTWGGYFLPKGPEKSLDVVNLVS